MPLKKLPSFDRAMLNELASGAQKTFDNADALYWEAKLLGAAGALSRALFLHQISLEECAKIENTGAWATSILAGFTVDKKRVLAGFASHARKNRTNAYMLKGSAAEQAAKKRGDWKVANEEFKKLQAEFHEKSNDAKNASLYVDFKDGKFIAPTERITKDMLDETAARNETFLRLMCPKLEMLLTRNALEMEQGARGGPSHNRRLRRVGRNREGQEAGRCNSCFRQAAWRVPRS
jgi:AbiV family abortive infection protein